MPETITVSRGGAAITITLRRAGVHNALDPVMMREITEAFHAAGDAPEGRTVILAAEGKSFCAGADLNWMREAAAYTPEENAADARVLGRMLQAIYDCPKPVLARVQGSAYGGGIGLVAACDLAVAVEPATFCFSEAKIGLTPAVIAPFVLRKMALPDARRYMLTAAPIRTEEAQRIGLIQEVAPSNEAADAILARWVNEIAANGPHALAVCKRILSALSGGPSDDLIGYCADLLAEVRAGDEAREGVQAFLERRPPSWRAGDGRVP